MEDIDLTSKNRYGESVILKYIEDDKYRLVTEFPYRIIYENDGSVSAVDPSGGPFLNIGSIVQNKEIIRISQTGILNLKTL